LRPSLTAPGCPLIRTLEGHSSEVNGVAITPDGCRAVSGSYDDTLRLWDLESGQTIRVLQGHTDTVWLVAVTAEGLRAVSGSKDKTLRLWDLWDLESGKEIATFTGEDKMGDCAIAPDGQTIIGGEGSGRVHILRLVEADETKPAIGDTKIQLLQRKEQAS
jgi:WD40 repeat protein